MHSSAVSAEAFEDQDAPRYIVLVVDDDPAVVQRVAATLRAKNFKVITAWNVRQAIGRIKQEHPDAVFTDLDMPKGSGEEVIVAAHRAGITHVIVVSDRSIKEDEIDAPPEGRILKPLDEDDIIAASDAIQQALH